MLVLRRPYCCRRWIAIVLVVITFAILNECVLCASAVGLGLYLVLVAFVPAWRDIGWNHWKIYSSTSPGADPDSWMVKLGFAKARKPVMEGDFNEKTAVRLYSCLGVLLMLAGLAGIIWIVYLNPGN